MLNPLKLGLSCKSLMIINLNTDVGNYNWKKLIVYSLVFLFTNHQEHPRKGGKKLTLSSQVRTESRYGTNLFLFLPAP